jgi:hypothetical protein
LIINCFNVSLQAQHNIQSRHGKHDGRHVYAYLRGSLHGLLGAGEVLAPMRVLTAARQGMLAATQ